MKEYRSENLGDGYIAHFYLAPGQLMMVRVTYEGTFVGQRKGDSHISAARWVRRQVKNHRKARSILKGGK